MPTLTTHISKYGAVTVTIEADPETDGLATLALESLAHEAATTAIVLWRTVHETEPEGSIESQGGDGDGST